MDELIRRLQVLSRKAAKLEAVVESLKTDNKTLEGRVAELENGVASQTEAYQTMVEQYETLKLVKSLDTSESRDAIKAKIDLYLKEIDLCLKSFGE